MKQELSMDEKIVELGRQMALASEAVAVGFSEVFKRLADQQAEMAKAAQAVLEPLAEQIRSFSLEPFLEPLAKAIERLPEKNREALITLANNGWYIDPELSLPEFFGMAAAFVAGDSTEANDAMCAHFDARADEIVGGLVRQLPKRAHLITAALSAHRREEYALSVPVFLAQADGICCEITGVQLYSRRFKDGVPKLASATLLKDASPLSLSMLAPIIEATPIIANARERGEGFDGLNRHAVLHGESTDYDTRLNSCRAMSLLAYVAWILNAKAEE